MSDLALCLFTAVPHISQVVGEWESWISALMDLLNAAKYIVRNKTDSPVTTAATAC